VILRYSLNSFNQSLRVSDNFTRLVSSPRASLWMAAWRLIRGHMTWLEYANSEPILYNTPAAQALPSPWRGPIGDSILMGISLKLRPEPQHAATQCKYMRMVACKNSQRHASLSLLLKAFTRHVHVTSTSQLSAALASASAGVAHSFPTYLNQFGRQSSFLSHVSPSVKRPLTQPLHFGELGQLKKGMCW
jgi:hypothetical protein